MAQVNNHKKIKNYCCFMDDGSKKQRHFKRRVSQRLKDEAMEMILKEISVDDRINFHKIKVK